MSVLDDQANRLPESLQRFVSDPGGNFGVWRKIDLDAWSLETLHVPSYPQARFQIGVALALAEKYGVSTARIEIQGPADRWSGRRESQVLTGDTAALYAAASMTFRLNAKPRTTHQETSKR